MHGKRYAGALVALMGVAGCSDRGGLPDNQPVQMQARLESFESCAALESYLEDTSVLDMRSTLERSKPSYWKSRGGWFGGGMVEDVASAPPSGSPTAPNPNSSAPKDYTGTNNQVAGVDEADFVKNDGTRLFVLSGHTLYLHRSWPAASLRAESSLTLEGWPRQMFLRGDQVIVFSEVFEPGSGQGKPGLDVAPCAPMSPCGAFGGSSSTRVTTVDVADLAHPHVTGELLMPGSYHDARMTGGSVRLVLREPVRWPEGMRWWPDYSNDLWDDQARLEKEIDRLMVQNEALLRARSLEDWLPAGRRTRPDGTQEAMGYDCADFHKTNAPTRPGFVSVVSLDLDAPVTQAPGRTTLVAAPDQIYATADALYLAAAHWWWWPEAGQTNYTYVHKLELTQAHTSQYAASGTVEGVLLNSFSMDEHEGVLRVATTIDTRVAEVGNEWGRIETTNRIFTFGREGDRLVKLGQSEALAPGERIFSARFLGDKGYVVTFRQVDPLFTFDLSDPAQPRKVGELKVPGFSTYIHPVGTTHLLTIGVDMAENGGWSTRALKLSLFDVTDPAHPREAFTQRVGTASSWSEALYDHKAFTWFAARGLVAIPFADWSEQYYGGDYWSGFVSDLRVFHVDPATGFTPVGALSMRDVYQSGNSYQWNAYYSPQVRRSVMADDYVYAITDAGVRVAHVNKLGQPLATSRFTGP